MKKTKNAEKIELILIVLLITAISLVMATMAWAKYIKVSQGGVNSEIAKWNITVNVPNQSRWSQTYSHVVSEKLAPGTSGYIPIDIYMNDTEVCARYKINIQGVQGNVPANLRVYRGKYDENNGYGKLKASDNGHALIEATNSPILIAKDTIGVPSTTGTVDHSVYPTTHHEEYRNTTNNQVEPGHVREYIYWEWPYETGTVNQVTGIADGDEQDSRDGQNATTNSTLTLTIKVDTVQINPEGETTFDIEYDLSGGAVATSNPDSYTTGVGEITLNNPTRTGYTFKGWSGTDLTGDTNLNVTIPINAAGDREYTANWTANTYYIKFNGNAGTGTMSNQTMTYDMASNLTANSFTMAGFIFKGWNTAADGSGTAYSNMEEVSNLTDVNEGIVNLFAQWETQPLKYAVQIYGINQDVDSSGNILGLTFGPATGANYSNAYVTHEYEEIEGNPGYYNVKIITHTVAADGSETLNSDYLKNSSNANVTRTQAQVTARQNISLHTMSWQQISAVQDKTLFEDCMLCGDTKSVNLTLNNTIRNGNVPSQYGDGTGMVRNLLKNYQRDFYAVWNPSYSQNSYIGTGVSFDNTELSNGSNARQAGGYSSSHVRATLIGSNSKTNEAYAGNTNTSANTCIYSCIQSDLRAVITPKKIKYVTGESLDNYTVKDDIADSIWLFSNREIKGTGEYSGVAAEGLGTNGVEYAKFSNTESKYYINNYTAGSNAKRTVYKENGTVESWHLRSILLNRTSFTYCVGSNGQISFFGPLNPMGICFGFCIK